MAADIKPPDLRVSHSANPDLFAAGVANMRGRVQKHPLFTRKMTFDLTNSMSLVYPKRKLDFNNHVLWLAV